MNVGGSKVVVKATAPSSLGKHTKRRASKPMVIASLIRADVAAGTLKLNVPLNARAKLALQQRGELEDRRDHRHPPIR